MTARHGHDHHVRLRDGTVLRGRWWECAHPQGIVLIRTPYDADEHASTARSWNARGYHCLVQDVRGRYRSAGRWSPYTHEHDDGGEVLARLAADHPGLPVVLYGASYAAHTALEAARAAAEAGAAGASGGTAAPSAVAAVIVLVPALGLAETAWDADGVPQLRHRIGWWHQHGRTPRPQPPLPPAELDGRVAQAREHGVIEAAADWGWTPHARAGWRRLWTARRIDLAARYGRVAAPLLVVSGDDDFFHHHAQRLARAWSAASHFASGPWGHGLVGGVTDPARRARITAAGGLAHIIDPWLSANGLPGTPAAWTGVLAPAAASRTRSVLDPASGTWHHERTAP
ncbi:alpha/beta hydrolase [Streptomonospora sp. S1-112]|uniref:Alpha/beta hydrolase n=1 Tax=Streptomonospora mangrovi TaxID=2883123 RepID=A0A9X3NNV7_9ACTN|nr:CocE/NonD family hydrolase [Streptomonospora mangrovi]MDA0565224.1 alpha/beta hydrolase [Streptomonospora mangrovi]